MESEREGAPEEEYPEYDEKMPRRLTAGPIIAIIVVVIILLGFGFYLFWGTAVEEVRILSVEEYFGSDDNYQGIEVKILAISSGAQKVDGTGKLEIIFKGNSVYSSDVKVKDDEARVRVPYTEFAMENGAYEVRFSLDGKSAKAPQDYFVRHIPHSLQVTIQEVYDEETQDSRPVILVTPKADIPEGGRAFLVKDYNKHFMITLDVTDPFQESDERTKTMYEWHNNRSTLQIDLDWEYMGNYTVSARFENLLVRSDSPYREITSEPEELTTFVNKAPVMGRIDHSPDRIKQNQEFELTVRASDRDTNGGIQYFMIDWDAADDEDELEVVYVTESLNALARVKHTYSTMGEKIITITAADNGYIDDSNPENPQYNKKFASTTYTVTVYLSVLD